MKESFANVVVEEKLSLAVVILTKNEAQHLRRLLPNLNSLGCEIYVIDSGSTDETKAEALRAGATFLQNPFINYSLQFQWALQTINSQCDWIMRLDADETLTQELIGEIQCRLGRLPEDVTGVNINRRHIFLGRWIKHGGRYPLTLLRIWRRGAARIEQRWMDEHMELIFGRAIIFKHDFADHNINDISFFIDKHNKYATREAIDVLVKRYDLGKIENPLTYNGTSFQAAAKRWVKIRIYNCLPFWLGPPLYFFYRYFFQLGFLDGPEGLAYHFLQGLWYRFLVGAKVFEFDRSLKPLVDKDARLAELARLTGYEISVLKGGG